MAAVGIDLLFTAATDRAIWDRIAVQPTFATQISIHSPLPVMLFAFWFIAVFNLPLSTEIVKRGSVIHPLHPQQQIEHAWRHLSPPQLCQVLIG